MRWPLGLFGRSRAAASEPPSAARPSAEPAWPSLPPIPLAAGGVELTARAGEFAAGLPGAVSLPRALQPLGHARSPEAPAGLVAGLATAQAYAGREPLALARRGRPEGRAAWAWPEAAEPEPAPAGEPWMCGLGDQLVPDGCPRRFDRRPPRLDATSPGG